LARFHTGRQGIIGFYGAFHGRTMGSLSITASKSLYRTGFAPTMNGVFHAPFPDPYRPLLTASENDYGETVVRFINDVILKKILPPEDCAAVIVEPIQGEGGYVVPPDDFFPALRELCDAHGILLIVDEIQSGVGRTGKMWAIEHWGVEPDIVCTAKGIASGIPLGGIITRASVMDWPTGAHGNTYGGNPVACAAGIATLELIEGGLLENASQVGEYTLDALAEIQARHPNIGDVRGKGLMIGVDLVKDQASKAHAHDLRETIVHAAFRRGLLTLGCGESTIRIAPPLTISRDLIDEGLTILEAAIQESVD
jgi:4-aminobutyrate aminotransferase